MAATVLQPAEVPRETGRAADEVSCTLRITSEVSAARGMRWELRCAVLRPDAAGAIRSSQAVCCDLCLCGGHAVMYGPTGELQPGVLTFHSWFQNLG